MRKILLPLLPFVFAFSIAGFASGENPGMIQSEPRFVQNIGQFDATDGTPLKDLLFFASSQGVDMYFFPDGISYVFSEKPSPDPESALPVSFKGHRVDMRWLSVSAGSEVIATGKFSSRSRYFRPGIEGRSADEFEKISYKNIWTGIDVEITLSGSLKYDYVIHPGADPAMIRFAYDGEEGSFFTSSGDLVVKHSLGDLKENAPYTYFAETGESISCKFAFNGVDGTFGFSMPDAGISTAKVIIDPTVSWGTLYGGSSNDGNLMYADMAADSQGDIYYVGNTGSSNFPVTAGAFQGTYGTGPNDVVIIKFDKAGNRKWATFMGGTSQDLGSGICVGKGDFVFITGSTNSTNFPVVGNVYQSSFDAITDAVLVKLDSAGDVIWSSYFGASGTDDGNRIAISADNYLYVVGNTTSPDLPVTAGAFQMTYNNANEMFLAKFDTSCNQVWTTFVGGYQNDLGNGIAISPDGGIYIAGQSASFDWVTTPGAYQPALNGAMEDAVIAKFNSSGTMLWSTFIGGSSNDQAYGLDCDAFANVYISGVTSSTNFPTTAGAYMTSDPNGTNFSVFLVKFSATGAKGWSTNFGGSTWDRVFDLTVGPNNDIYLIGDTRSTNMPVTGDALQGTFGGGFTDVLILKFSDNGAFTYGSFLGGLDQEYGRGIGSSAIDGSFFINGYTVSNPFPTTGNVFQSTFGGGANDAFMYYFTDCAPISPVLSIYDTIGFCAGDSVLLDPGTNPTYSYAWSTGSSATKIYAKTPGTYHVTVSDTGACSGSDTVVIVTGAAPTAGITALSATSFCEGGSVVLQGTGANSLYNWYINGTLLAGYIADTLLVDSASSFTIVADPQLCSDSLATPVSVVVNPNPLLEIGNDTVICGGSILTLDAGMESGAVYTWNNLSTADTLNVSVSGTYYVNENFPSTTCSASDTVSVTVTTGTVTIFPWSEDLETFGLCGTTSNCGTTVCILANGFINEINGTEDDIDWRTSQGPTPSNGFGTGPTIDHKPGNATGNYVYLEPSMNCNYQDANLISPCLDLNNVVSPELKFWYHMYGQNMGTLRLDIWGNGKWNSNVFTETLDQGNQWNMATISLLKYQGQLIRLRWRGNTANGGLGDMAIDDINVGNVTDLPIANFGATVVNPCMNDTVKFFDDSEHNVSAWKWTITPNTFTYVNGTDSTSENPEVIFNATGYYSVTMIGTNLVGSDTLSKASYIELVTPKNLPFLDDLESYALCPTTSDCEVTVCPLGNGFGNPQNGFVDDMDWRVNQGYTPTNQTGPQSGMDYNPGTATGNYLYTEASNCNDKIAHLLFPCLDLTGTTDPALIFYANMRGQSMGDLHVDAKVNGIWNNDLMTPISGDHGNLWFIVQVPLDSFIGQVVTIRVRGETGGGNTSDMCIDDIKVYDQVPPLAAFSVTNTCIGDTTVFTNTSTGYVSSIDWAFGNGAVPDSASGLGPFQVYYANPGTYTVTMIATNPIGSDTITQSITIDTLTLNAVSIALTGGTIPGCGGQPLTFTATPVSGGGSPVYNWLVTDSLIQTGSSPTFTNSSLLNSDTVVCEMYSSATCPAPSPSISNGIIPILDDIPVANFVANVNGETVNFSDASVGGPTSFLWDLGDGTTSTLQNPSHFYGLDGNYFVCLTATDSCGFDSVCQIISVNCGFLAADFSKIINGFTVSFVDSTTGNPTSHTWDFGDGSPTSASQNPVHTFPGDSVYLICLYVTDTSCSDTFCDSLGLGIFGVDGSTMVNNYRIYPNPATDQIMIRWNEGGTKPDAIGLLNIVGQRVVENRGDFAGKSIYILDVSGISNGVYFVEIVSGDARGIGKIIIRK